MQSIEIAKTTFSMIELFFFKFRIKIVALEG